MNSGHSTKNSSAMVNSHEKPFDSTLLDSKIERCQPICNEVMSSMTEGETLSQEMMIPLLEQKETRSGTMHTSTCQASQVGGPKTIEDNKEPAARMHNTRGRNGIKKQRIELYSPDDLQDRNNDDLLLSSCAISLASLDRRTCARLLVKDANSVMDEILQPMSFPWTHLMAPFMRIPRDIEDLPEIQTAGSTSHSIVEHRKYKVEEEEMQTIGTLMASRRSGDPGKIQLTRLFDQSCVQRNSFRPARRIDAGASSLAAPGGLILEVFQDIQNRHETESEMMCRNLKTTNVSFRLACASSKATILEKEEDGRIPLVIPAMMPRIVQEGKRRRGDIAFKQAKELGSYNCRATPVQSTPSSNARPRTWVGRTRLIWSEQENPNGSSQRGQYKSIITGERLDHTAHKRPLHVKVAIQVGNRILSTNQENMKKISPALEAVLSSSDPGKNFSYSPKIVNEALDRNLARNTLKDDHSQCILNIEKFLSNIQAEFTSDSKSHFLDEVLRDYEVVAKFEEEEVKLSFDPPRLDCTFTDDGIISVSCSKYGSFRWEGSKELALERILFEFICATLDICQACFRSMDKIECGVCPNCGYCSAGKSLQGRLSLPTSDVREEKISLGNYKRSDRLCSICKLDCGSLIWDSVKQEWYHRVCIIWTGYNCSKPSIKEYRGTCNFCSSGSSSIVRCAAENCEICFHPMCAVIASKTAESRKNRFEISGLHEYDAYLCTQYELLMLNVSTPSDSDAVSGKSTTVPIAFCGYHNTRRKADHFGLYPGCCYLEDSMRIPPRRDTIQ